MKISNAIRNVERIFMNFPDIVSEEDIESFEIAVSAMEKQDPMKPVDKETEYACGQCDTHVAYKDDYCWHCGQKLDWEAKE